MLGGTLRDLYPVVKDEADAAFERLVLPAPGASVRLALSRLGPDAASVGAAETIFEFLFDDPAGVIATAHRGPVRPRAKAGVAEMPLLGVVYSTNKPRSLVERSTDARSGSRRGGPTNDTTRADPVTAKTTAKGRFDVHSIKTRLTAIGLACHSCWAWRVRHSHKRKAGATRRL